MEILFILFVYVFASVHHMYTMPTEAQRDPLELELEIVVSMYMLETVGPVKSSQCFYPLNHVSSPHFEFSSEETNMEWV